MSKPTIAFPQITEKDKIRFLHRVKKDGPVPAHCPELGPCWIWTAACNGCGYGAFRVGGQQVRAHRFAWAITGNAPDGLLVLHKCDVKKCVNPDHLFLGTVRDNTIDMIAKGRHAHGDAHFSRARPHLLRRGPTHPMTLYPERRRGENNGNARLTEQSVMEIRHLFASGGMTLEYLGRVFGVSGVQIGNIIKRRSWAHEKRDVEPLHALDAI